MTSPEMALAERIRDQIVDLDRSVARASAAWERGKVSVDQDYYLDAVSMPPTSYPARCKDYWNDCCLFGSGCALN